MTSRFFDLSTRTALVVGSSRGIGRAIAEGYAEAGASLALASRTEADLLQVAGAIRASGGRVEVFAADVARVADAQALVREASLA
jgi:NAD(P)-dependent dehydrogenase (short-subunit alcohol dehydrogenase family)